MDEWARKGAPTNFAFDLVNRSSIGLHDRIVSQDERTAEDDVGGWSRRV
jgi:hypothetical protein